VVALVTGDEPAEAVLRAWNGEGFQGFATRVASARDHDRVAQGAVT
jgi:hypothetical protein